MGKNMERILNREISMETQMQDIRSQSDKKFKASVNNSWGKIIPSIRVGTVVLSNPNKKDLEDNPRLLGKLVYTKLVTSNVAV